MFNPLTKVLIKIFANGFYKVHAGFFLFLFVSIIIYFFFIEVLNQTHLLAEQILEYNLLVVLTFVSNPIMAGIVFIVWLIYTIKSWNYITEQLAVSNYHFLFYSSTSMSWKKQFTSWLMVQWVISLPIICFALFAMIIGIVYRYYLIPAIIPFYILLLTSVSAYVYVRQVNKWADSNYQSYLFKTISKWPKPFYSLFIYHILDKMKLALGITKIISCIIIVYVYALFSSLNNDLRDEYIIILTIIAAHTVLIYQSHQFEQVYLSFIRNFPYTRIKLFINSLILYFLLLLPESIWILCTFKITAGVQLLLFGLTIALLFRSLLYLLGITMSKYLPLVFGICILLYLIILFNFTWVLVPISLSVAFILFFTNYYR